VNIAQNRLLSYRQKWPGNLGTMNAEIMLCYKIQPQRKERFVMVTKEIVCGQTFLVEHWINDDHQV
jgi:hypothetical protein